MRTGLALSDAARLRGQIDRAEEREMLRVEVMRLAHRYAATMAEEADRIRHAEGGARLGYFTIGWKLGTRSAALNIAMDENAVENLLDMLVLASLTRHSVESHWAPKFLGSRMRFAR